VRALPALFLGGVLLCGAASTCAAQETTAAPAPAQAGQQPVRELEPVHVNAMRNPEVRKYKVILAGLDAFDDYHRMAPQADKLRFRLDPNGKAGTEDAAAAAAPALAARLVGNDGFKLALPLDADLRFTVPRSDAAEDADSELELNRKRNLYRIRPSVRSPGLPAHHRRLGDLRLECRVTVAMAKEEMPFMVKALVNGILLTTDWCSFFDNRKNATFSMRADAPLREAVIVEGNRSALLRTTGRSYHVPLGEGSWSDEAVIELDYAGPPAPGADNVATASAP